jgi:hypothetical protein
LQMQLFVASNNTQCMISTMPQPKESYQCFVERLSKKVVNGNKVSLLVVSENISQKKV